MNKNIQYEPDHEADDKIKDMIYGVIVKLRLSAGKDIFEAFENQHIKYAVHKGAVLSKSLYDSPLTRKSGDTDILIDRKNIETVKAIFTANGFIQARVVEDSEKHEMRTQKFNRAELIYQASQSHQLAPFIKETGNKLCPYVNYDVNTDIFWGESGIHTDMDSFLDNTTEIEIYGIKLRRLTPEAEFIAMCMHHYKDLNSIYLLWTGGLKKSEIEEIYLYVKKDILNLEKLCSLSEKYRVTDYVYYCVSKAYEIYNDVMLTGYMKELETESGQALLDCYGLCDSERKNWTVDFKTLYNSDDIKEYMRTYLTEADFRKININVDMM